MLNGSNFKFKQASETVTIRIMQEVDNVLQVDDDFEEEM